MRLLFIAVCWVLGISLARVSPALTAEPWAALTILLASAALALRGRRYCWLLIMLVAVAAGGWRQALVPRSSEVASYNGYIGTISGIVIDEPRRRADSVQARVAVDSVFANQKTAATSGLVLIEARGNANIAYGDRIRATGALALPATWDRFSYAHYLGRQNVFSIMQNAAVEVLDSGLGDPFFSRLLDIKGSLRRQIADALPEPQAGLLTGILLGDESGIAPEVSAAFERAGAAHVVAISGFNMVIVSAIVIRLLAHIFRGNKAVIVFGAVTIILLYALFVGAKPGILRAALMSSLLVIGAQLNRKTFVPASMAFATVLLSLADPNVLLDIGFQLSLFAVLGLSVFADPLSDRFRRLLLRILPAPVVTPLHNFLNEPLIVSLAAQIATFPLIMLYFGRFSLVAIPVNLLIVPMQTAVLLLGLAAVVLSVFVPALGLLVFWAELLPLSWTITIVRLFGSWEFADLPLMADSRLLQGFYLLLIGGAMLRYGNPTLWQRLLSMLLSNAIKLTALAASGIVTLLLLAMAISRPDGQLHLWLLDMGHSNAVLIQTPGGMQGLVDGGRFPTRLLTAIGDRLPFYDREIEFLAITHPDAWDIAALSAVLERYTVGVTLYHGQANTGADYLKIREQLTRSESPIVTAHAGKRLEFSDGVLLEILHPQGTPNIIDRLGDQALVLRLSYGEVSFLLTSDLSVAGQRELLAAGISPAATVLQIPQHGGARAVDGEFLAQAAPQVALLQSDIANRRGDPDPDTLARFVDVPLLRTDEIGTIHLSTDGVELHLHN